MENFGVFFLCVLRLELASHEVFLATPLYVCSTSTLVADVLAVLWCSLRSSSCR